MKLTIMQIFFFSAKFAQKCFERELQKQQIYAGSGTVLKCKDTPWFSMYEKWFWSQVKLIKEQHQTNFLANRKLVNMLLLFSRLNLSSQIYIESDSLYRLCHSFFSKIFKIQCRFWNIYQCKNVARNIEMCEKRFLPKRTFIKETTPDGYT